jgi:hypothetical protein
MPERARDGGADEQSRCDAPWLHEGHEEIEEHEQQEEEVEPRSRSFLPFDPIVTFVLPV